MFNRIAAKSWHVFVIALALVMPGAFILIFLLICRRLFLRNRNG